MTAGTNMPFQEAQVEPGEAVRRITVPSAVQARCTLDRVDYADAFLVDVGQAQDQTSEHWARSVIEGAPPRTRRELSRGWFTLGLRLGPSYADQLVLGWEVRRNTPDLVLLGAKGRLGLAGELLFERQRDTLLFATFVQLDNCVARAAWAGIASRHRQVVRHLLERAVSEPHHDTGSGQRRDPV
jgi:hypothetical protein